MKYILLLASTCSICLICSACASSSSLECDDPAYENVFRRGGAPRYVFGNKVMPYEGYMELEAFRPSKRAVAIADSVLTNEGSDTEAVEFAQYGGFIDQSGDRIVAANYVYEESGDYPEARCEWFYGLGRYFEENTRQGYVDLDEGTVYEIGPKEAP